MAGLKLRIYGDPILRQTAECVEVFDKGLSELAEGMISIMLSEKGIGLAAPQVGVSRRLIVALKMKDPDDTGAPPLVLVNPEVVTRSNDTWIFEEGCLSVPGVSAPVVRSRETEVRYHDLSGREQSISGEGIFGRILLHEIDHLDGRLFIDYLSSARKSLVKSKLKNLTQSKRLF